MKVILYRSFNVREAVAWLAVTTTTNCKEYSPTQRARLLDRLKLVSTSPPTSSPPQATIQILPGSSALSNPPSQHKYSPIFPPSHISPSIHNIQARLKPLIRRTNSHSEGDIAILIRIRIYRSGRELN